MGASLVAMTCTRHVLKAKCWRMRTSIFLNPGSSFWNTETKPSSNQEWVLVFHAYQTCLNSSSPKNDGQCQAGHDMPAIPRDLVFETRVVDMSQQQGQMMPKRMLSTSKFKLYRPAAEPQKCRGTISQIHALTPQEALHRVIGRVKTCIFHMGVLGVKLQWNLRILDFWFRRFVFGKNNQSVDFAQNILYTLQTTPTRVGVPGCSHFMFVRNTLWCWWFMSLVALRVGLMDYTICGYTDWFTGDAALWLSRWTMHCAGHEDVLCGGHFSSTDT